MNNYLSLRKDNQLLVLTHLSQLITFVVGFGSLILPLILWLTNKDRVYEMDKHGKAILNFQISLLIYAVASIPLMLFFGFGLLVLLFVAIISFVSPIINAVRVSRGEEPSYSFSLAIIK